MKCPLPLATLLVALAAPTALAQLQITEIMYDSASTNDGAWEWIEVRNTGAAPIDLNGAWVSRIGATYNTSFSETINSGNVPIGGGDPFDTVVPAGGIAVLFDGFQATNSPANFDLASFRTAWGIPSTVPVMPGNFFPGLTNSGANTNVGIWADRASYELDHGPNTGTNPFVVTSYNNALASVDWDVAAPWPTQTGSNGFSIEWSGTGSQTDGGQWKRSVAGTRGAVTSVASFVATTGTPINNANDFGSPGAVHSTPIATDGKLIITEVMYNAASSEPQWEWVEVYNNTGAAIDFGSNPGILDDGNNVKIAAPNITSGSIPAGGVAVLYNSALDPADFAAAWDRQLGDPGFGSVTNNYIPVSDWQSLNNSLGGADTESTSGTGALENQLDILSVWASQSDYDAVMGNPTDASANPLAVLRFSDQSPWTAANGPSIFLTDLTNSTGNGFNADGSLWGVSNGVLDNPLLSYAAHEVLVTGQLQVHPGGDVASPGVFTLESAPTEDADFNGDGIVDAEDFTVWRDNLVTTSGATNATGDANGDGAVNAADFDLWKARFGGTSGSLTGAAVPEPATWLLSLLAVAGLATARRR